jgi:hypothetical protein
LYGDVSDLQLLVLPDLFAETEDLRRKLRLLRKSGAGS